MSRMQAQVDVLVLGEHPAAYLAAALLRHKTKLSILHATIPEERPADRLVMVNPLFWSLHPFLESLRRKIESRSVYGLAFLADDVQTRSEFRSKSAVACIASLKDIRNHMHELARAQGVEFVTPRQIQVRRLDEVGIDLLINGRPLRCQAMVLAGTLPAEQQRILGMPEEWERGVVHRYTYARIRNSRLIDMGGRPLVPMSLDLRNLLSWAWLLPGERYSQLAIEQPIQRTGEIDSAELLLHWARILEKHGILRSDTELAPDTIESADLPLGGALAHEGVANRTLLVGPAGGFYTASGEDVYPNCWSAIFAAEILKKALKEPHLQDALQPYRQRWRTTLGDYLRGPHQNLRFLLPLVYRNQVMTNRLAEAILMGRSVIR